MSVWARAVLSVWLASLAAVTPRPQAHTDFSGRWTFDRAKSAQPWNGRIVIAAILGDECVVTQDATSLRLAITTGGRKVTAVYNLTGESRNLSPGDIPVTSRTAWEGDRLAIASVSAVIVKGEHVTIETRRVMWLDGEGNLMIERTGTPASEVTPSRSVYTRVPGASRLPPRASLLRLVVHDVLDRLLLAAEAGDLDHRLGRLLLEHVLAVEGGHPLVLG